MSTMHRPKLSASILVLVLVAPPLASLANTAQADAVTTPNVTMPTEAGTSAVYHGGDVYLFGGTGCAPSPYCDLIVRYDTETFTFQTMNARLPQGRAYTSAVMAGGYAYIFGGVGEENGETKAFANVWRYNPLSDTLTDMGVGLPTARAYTSAAWDGQSAYIFGGTIPGPFVVVGLGEAILRYTPSTNTVSLMNAKLPGGGLSGTSAVWDGTRIVVAGGAYTDPSPSSPPYYWYPGAYYFDGILHYNPASDTLQQAPNKLPSPRFGMSAVWNGQSAYMMGGEECLSVCTLLDQIVRYTPTSGSVTVMGARLTTPRSYTSAAWGGTYVANVHVFGGSCAGSCKQALRYSLAPAAPTAVVATAGPGRGEITVTWQAPAPNTYDYPRAVTYDIYRSNGLQDDNYVFIGRVISGETSFWNTTIPDGASKCYAVVAVTTHGASPRSSTVGSAHCATTFAAPRSPQAVVARAGPGAGEVTLQWQAPTSDGGTPVTGYGIYRNRTGSRTVFDLVQNVNAQTRLFVDGGLPHGQTRCYKVSARNLVGEGPWSTSSGGENCATTFSPPGPPRLVRATAGPGVGEVTVEWQAPASDGGTPVTGYQVNRSLSESGPSQEIGRTGSVLSYRDAGLPSASRRCYWVAARNLAGEGSKSTPVGSEHCATTFGPPGEPRLLTASRGPGAGQISLAWEAPLLDGGTPVTGYDVLWSFTPTGSFVLLQDAGNANSYVHGGLAHGEQRCYRVSARNAAGTGPQGGTACARAPNVPEAPRNLNAAPGPGSAILAWDAPADDGGFPIAHYRVYRALGGASFQALAETPESQRTHEDATCPAGVECAYLVRALNQLGEGPASNTASHRGSAISSYVETFDTGTAKFSALSGLWHISDCRSLSPAKSLAYNRASVPCPPGGARPDYDTAERTLGEAVTLPFLLPAGKTSKLTFSSWFENEQGCAPDKKQVAIRESDVSGTVNGSWVPLINCEQGAVVPLVFTEIQRLWYGRSVDIPNSLSGKMVQVGFFFDSSHGGANTFEGWYVDDVNVVSPS